MPCGRRWTGTVGGMLAGASGWGVSTSYLVCETWEAAPRLSRVHGRGARRGGRFAVLKAQGDHEHPELYSQPPTGAARPLTQGSFIHGSPVWAHDGRRVAFYGNDRDSLSYDVYVADVTSGAAPTLLVGGREDTWYPLDWSSDDTKLLVWKYVSITESYLYLADAATGALTPLDDPAHPRKAGIPT